MIPTIRSLILATFCVTHYLALAQIHEVSISEVSPSEVRYITYGTDSLDRGFYILPSSDSTRLVSCLTYESGRGNPLLLNVTDALEVDQQFAFPDSQFGFWFAGVKANDGSVLMSGFRSTREHSLDCYLTRIAGDGRMLWSRSYGGPGHQRGYKAAATRDGGFVIAAQTDIPGQPGIAGHVVKIDGKGDTVWTRTFRNTNLCRLYSVVELAGGDLIVSGITKANYPEDSDIIIYKLDGDGMSISDTEYATSKGDIAHSMIAGPENTFIIAGYSAEQSDSLSDAMLLHYDADFQLRRKALVKTGWDVKLINGFLDTDGNYIGTGFLKKDLRSDTDLLLFRYHFRSGEIVMKSVRISDRDEEAYHAAPFGPGRALIAGHTMGTGNGDVLLLEWQYDVSQ